MNGEEYKKTLERLNLTQVSAADFLNVRDTTSRRWSWGEHPIPRATEMLLRVMVKHRLSIEDVLALMPRRKDQ